MNGDRQGALGSMSFVSLALSSIFVAVSCAGGDAGASSTPASPGPTPKPTPALDAVPTPAQPPSLAPAAAFKHQSIPVAIPDDAVSVPELDPDATITAVLGSPDPAATPVPFVSEASVDTTDRRLHVTVGGETVYIRNGGRIEMGDDLAVEVYIDPYPPTTLHSILDVYVTRDGEPVDDISVDVEFDMLSMLHGPFVATARDIGGGHHLATLDYIMFGAWDQFVTIRLGLDRIRFPVVIIAYP